MSLPPLPLIDGCLFVDNSFLDTFCCPRKLEYERLEKLVPSADAPALNFGSAIHLALEFRYSHPKMHIIELEPLQAEILREHFQVNPQPEGDHRDLNFAVDVIKRYNSRNMVEPFNVLKYDKPVKCRHCEGTGYTIPDPTDESSTIGCLWCSGTGHEEVMVELPFTVPLFTWEGMLEFAPQCDQLTKIPIIYTGRIDLPVLWDDQLILIDHKTTSQLGATYFDQFRMAAQMLGYCWAWEQTTGRKVDGFAVNALRSKEPTKKIMDGLATKAEIEKWWSEGFYREKEYIQPHKLEEWKFNTIDKIERFFWNYSRGYMPQETKCCTMFGRCGYYDVCYMPADQRRTLLESTQFKVNDWNPLHPNKT